jgi:hypothetical protein
MGPQSGSPSSRRSVNSPSSIERAVGRLSLTRRRSKPRSRGGGSLPEDNVVDEWGKTASERVRLIVSASARSANARRNKLGMRT